MSDVLVLDEDAIRARVGAQSFSRGVSYFRSGAIFDARRQGPTLKARCHGSSGNTYRVEAMLSPEGIVAADCSCPVGGGGHCKHVAALLLTWGARPESFTEVEGLDAALDRRSKAELIALIKQMLRREPELEVLLETPLPVAGQKSGPIDPEIYRRQVKAFFDEASHEWGAVGEIGEGLIAIKEIADGFAAQEEYANAATIYRILCDEVRAHFDFEDDEGSLSHVIIEAVPGLGRCLEGAVADAETRVGILETLFDVYCLDIERGGTGLSDDAYDLLTEQTTPEERRLLAEKVRAMLAADPRARREWAREAYGGLLLDLEAETLDDESYLRICRESGRLDDLTERLLALGRLEEAVAAAGEASDYELMELADLFEQAGHAATAEELVRKRSETSQDSRLREWLKKRALARNDPATALDLAIQLFKESPSLEQYREARALATSLGRWDKVRPALRKHAEGLTYSDLHIEIYLDDGEIDPALEAVRSRRRTHVAYGWGYLDEDSITIRVARAAEEARPREAMELYQKEIQSLIDQRGRDQYRLACSYLKRVRALYDRLGERDTWEHYLHDLRERTRTLRALKEEMAAAKL